MVLSAMVRPDRAVDALDGRSEAKATAASRPHTVAARLNRRPQSVVGWVAK
ncbi:MAG: hypothetical protein ACHQ1E_02765 [Ktedonobacterales bacterium]